MAESGAELTRNAPAPLPEPDALPFSPDPLSTNTRGIGYWAFWLNRISGLVLTAYLLVHLGFLSALYRGPEAYNAFISIVSGKMMVYLDVLLAAAAIYHGFNGVRLSLVGAGIGVGRQVVWFWTAFGLGLVALALLAWRMIAGG